MIRRTLSIVPGLQRLLVAMLIALAAVLFTAEPSQAAVGDHVPSFDFSLSSGNTNPLGITWDDTYLRVVDHNRYIHTYSSTGTVCSTTFCQDWSSSTTAANQPKGITYDGTYLWTTHLVFPPWGLAAFNPSTGRYVSSEAFSFPSGVITRPRGVAWDGTYFRVVDELGTVYTYGTDGTRVTSQDFDLDGNNQNSTGITYDGTYFRVTDVVDDKVYAYTLSGTYSSTQDFDLVAANTDPQGITYDGTYLRVVDSSVDKVFTYEGLAQGPVENYGLGDDDEYEAEVDSAVVEYDDWKCVRDQTGANLRVSNARLTVHGFCIQLSDTDGMEVELHLSSTSSYADLNRFADVTGSWWLIESGGAAVAGQRIYDDNATDPDGNIVFTEELGGLEASDRLGFSTMAKSVVDDDCAEAGEPSDEDDPNEFTGFTCTRAHYDSLRATDDSAVLLFSLTDENKVEFADTPTIPESPTITRNADYTTATLSWELYDAVSLYEIQRATAVQVEVADASRIEYGNPVTFTVDGTQAGIDEYEDTTIEAHRTYQYRMRARGADSTSWSSWTEYVFSGAKPQVDLQPPGNLEITRDTGSIIASWTAPPGDLDNYTLQRQELVVVQGTTFFGNVVTLGENDWLPGDSTMYADSSILPTQIYEYRVAAVLDNQVGTYSEWFRIGPQITDLGAAPENFRVLASGNRILDERREFWMAWDSLPAADDYEVQILTFDLMTGGQSTKTRIVTDPTYFQTSFGRVGLRVRGRKLDADICSTSPDNRCLSNWTSWYQVRFTPAVTIPLPELPDDTTDTSTMELRAAVADVLKATLEPAGAEVNPYFVMEFIVLVAAFGSAILSIALSWKRGMAPLGAGMGAAIAILILFAGYRLLGTAVAWPIAAQFIVAVLGLIALVRQTGVFR